MLATFTSAIRHLYKPGVDTKGSLNKPNRRQRSEALNAQTALLRRLRFTETHRGTTLTPWQPFATHYQAAPPRCLALPPKPQSEILAEEDRLVFIGYGLKGS
jgi:hypothetical protein